MISAIQRKPLILRFISGRPWLGAVLVGLLAAVPGDALAQTEGATVGLFIRESASRPCDINLPSCEDENMQLAGETDVPYYVFLCVFNGDASRGISGVSCGISYSSSTVSIQSWNACADLEFSDPAWPASGSSNVLTWNVTQPPTNCQKTVPAAGQGVTALAGYFYLTAYGDAKVQVIPKRQTGQIDVSDCDGAQYQTREGGFISFSPDGSTEGGLPCRKTEQTTWSKIKETQGGSN